MAAVLPVVTRLSSRVVRVLGCNPGPMTLQGTNTYLLGTGTSRLLVDSGEGVPGWGAALRGVLEEQGCRVEHLLLTHWHPDHVGGAAEVQEMAGGRCTIHKWPREGDKELMGGLEVRALQEGQVLGVEGAEVEVVHTPGHTPDHLALHLREEGALLTGDCILGEGTAVFESLHHYMNSLDRILCLGPRRLYPGHGPVVEEPGPKIEYYIKHRREREEQVLACLSSGPLTSMAIVEAVYTTTPPDLHKAANVNVLHHLDKLEVEGRVVREEQLWCLKS